MTARNDITGDVIATKGSTDAFRSGWDRIFGKKNTELTVQEGEVVVGLTITDRDVKYVAADEGNTPD